MRRFSHALTITFALILGPLVGVPASAQQGTQSATNSPGSASGSGDPLNTSPRGLTDIPQYGRVQPLGAGQAPSPAAPQSGPPAVTAPSTLPSSMPPDPARADRPVVFGSQIFSGRFGTEPFAGFNPDYQIAIGDRVAVRMWGAFTFDAVLVVDAQGNLFLPNVGPIQVAGIRNGELSKQLEGQVKRTFKSNVGVYATLEAAQPVKVYVTGFVRAPGLYGGLSSNSVLYYLDRAGGIDADRGSYLQVEVLRAGKKRATVNLYKFLIEGQIDPLQLQDGDTIVALPRKHVIHVNGEVLNPYVFEFDRPRISGSELLAVARPRPGATHLSIVRSVGAQRRSEYHPLSDAGRVTIEDGDEVSVSADKYQGTILVRAEGAHSGERVLILPYGAQLKDAIARLKPAPQARIESLQLFRRSVAQRQKELLETSLRGLETYALTSRSATSEEAALRGREAQQILEFIDRARKVEPRGQVILAQGSDYGDILLEDGDVLRIPERSQLVLVSGEVMFPNALAFESRAMTEDYISRSGGYTQGADKAKVLVVRQDGSVLEARAATPQPGDEIMVLPKIETKSVELTRGITQIIYQLAVSAKVLFGL